MPTKIKWYMYRLIFTADKVRRMPTAFIDRFYPPLLLNATGRPGRPIMRCGIECRAREKIAQGRVIARTGAIVAQGDCAIYQPLLPTADRPL